MRKKGVATFLAFFLWLFGTHRYYLGQKFLGILYTVAFFFTFAMTVGENEPIILLPAVIAFIDFVLLAAMPKEIFDRKYNKHIVGEKQAAWSRPDYTSRQGPRRKRRPKPLPEPTSRKKLLEKRKQDAIRLYRSGKYRDSIRRFEEVLELTPEDPIVHFNLACCHSMLQESSPAFYHLEQAVAKNFPDKDKIFEHQALAWLNHLDEMDAFVSNGFIRPEQERAIAPVALETEKGSGLRLQQTESGNSSDPSEANGLDKTSDLLEKIEELGKLKEMGILTEEEFQLQKQRWLQD
jgi:tetratricopeptide (TPR) repeat protein